MEKSINRVLSYENNIGNCAKPRLGDVIIKTRIVKIDDRYYPQYYDNGIFGFFKGWKFYKDEDIWLNGIYTFSTECNLSYKNFESAKGYLNSLNHKIEIVYE